MVSAHDVWPWVSASITATVSTTAIGSLAALSISTVVESLGGRGWRRRIEKMAAASVDEMMAASSRALSDGQPSNQWSTPNVPAAVSTTPQVARPPAGRATAMKSDRLVAKPAWKRMSTRAKLPMRLVRPISPKCQMLRTSLPNKIPLPSATRITGTLQRSSHTAATTMAIRRTGPTR